MGWRAAAMLQGANLEHVRIIPALTKSRVRENEAYRVFKGEQPFFVLQNQIVSRNIVAFITATFQRTVYLATFLVNAEITGVCAVDINGAEVLLVWCMKQCQVFIQNICIFLLEDFSVFGVDLIAVFIVFTVFCNLINKE